MVLLSLSRLNEAYAEVLDSIIFITADVTALVIQAVGGALASIANTLEGADRGGNIMLAGIVIQLGTHHVDYGMHQLC